MNNNDTVHIILLEADRHIRIEDLDYPIIYHRDIIKKMTNNDVMKTAPSDAVISSTIIREITKKLGAGHNKLYYRIETHSHDEYQNITESITANIGAECTFSHEIYEHD